MPDKLLQRINKAGIVEKQPFPKADVFHDLHEIHLPYLPCPMPWFDFDDTSSLVKIS